MEFPPDAPQVADPLMGWTSSTDTRAQVQLTFDTKEEAVAFAEKHGLAYLVEEPHRLKFWPKSYADNFLSDTTGSVAGRIRRHGGSPDRSRRWAPVAQRIEQPPSKRQVAGSSPAGRAN